MLNCTSTKKVWQYIYYKYTQRYKLFSTFTQSLIPLRRIMGCILDGSSSFSLCWLHSFLIHIFLTSIYVSLQVSVSPFVTLASIYSTLLSKWVSFSFSVASLDLQDVSKELRKSEIFLMLPVMTSMYSRLAQSCWIGLWWL